MLPHREWTNFYIRTIERASDDNVEDTPAKWTTRHIAYSIIGDATVGAAPTALYYSWKTIVKPAASDFALLPSMDEIVDFAMTINAAIQETGCAPANFDILWDALDCPLPIYEWSPYAVTGRHYDGVNQWQGFPYHHNCDGGDTFDDAPADYPITEQKWIASNVAPATKYGNQSQDMLFQQGLAFYVDAANYGGACGYPLPDNTELSGYIEPLRLIVNYLNPVVNSLSRNSMAPTGGVQLIFTGLGFDQDDLELSSVTRSWQNIAEAWASTVDVIEFVGQQGQGTTTLNAPADFTVDSDTQITITAMPALAVGTYHIRLIKSAVATIGVVDGYFGDWSCDVAGRASAGTRRSFFVGTVTDSPKPPILTFTWPWIINGLPVDKYYAPIDVRAPETFWDGRVLGVSSLKRSIDTMTGMFNISDVNVDLASNDFEFQMLLAQGHCKNQVVEIMHGWTSEPVGWMGHMFHGIVDDYGLQGPTFRAVLKDISRRHFRKTMPRFTVDLDLYPDAHESAVGQGIPDPVGLHSLTTGTAPGTFEALCVDTTLRKYVAAGAPVGLLEVYSAGVEKTLATHYTISYEDGGRTYITFTTNQRDKKITFNCTGYSLPAWDDPVNGYVQNPAYVLGFYLIYLCQVPINFIDLESLEEVAQLFIDGGWETIGRLPAAASQDADAYLQELLFSFGIKMWPDMRGRFKFGRKELGNIATDNIIFAQIDTQDAPDRPYNLESAVNYAKARWDYHPAASLWKAADEVANQPAIDFYGGHRHEGTWDYPCITSAAFAAVRINEDLNRLAYGHRVVSFTLPLEFIDELEIFDNFRLQDPFDISATGAGNPGHYYYISSLEYDFQNQKLKVEAEDLQWLMGQCMIIGRTEDLNNDYNTATPWQRSFAYVGRCAEGTFANGDPNKQVCNCD